MTAKELIRRQARVLEFEACGFCRADPPEAAARFQVWLEAGRHGEMNYLPRTAHKRADPQQVLPGAQSLVVLALNYGRTDAPTDRRTDAPTRQVTDAPAPRRTGLVARYARFSDYHRLMGERLRALAEFIDHAGPPGTRSLWYVDTGPILERDAAQRAGLGFMGKHTNLIHRRLGNWILLGEILTTLELEPDPPEKNRCGSCARCLAACPTQAIIAPFELDARRCISYLTIELRGSIPVEFRVAIGNRIFGCDDCLAVCPWNRFAQDAQAMRNEYRQDLAQPDLIELLELDEAEFRRRFAGTPLWRAKRRGLRRNVCVALGNVGEADALPVLARAANDADPLVAEHAAWARSRIQQKLRTRETTDLR